MVFSFVSSSSDSLKYETKLVLVYTLHRDSEDLSFVVATPCTVTLRIVSLLQVEEIHV